MAGRERVKGCARKTNWEQRSLNLSDSPQFSVKVITRILRRLIVHTISIYN